MERPNGIVAVDEVDVDDPPRTFCGKQCAIIVGVVSLILVISFSVSFYFIFRSDLKGKNKVQDIY